MTDTNHLLPFKPHMLESINNFPVRRVPVQYGDGQGIVQGQYVVYAAEAANVETPSNEGLVAQFDKLVACVGNI